MLIEPHDPPQTAYNRAIEQLNWELANNLDVTGDVDRTGLAIIRIHHLDSDQDTFLISRQRLAEMVCAGVSAGYELAPQHAAEALRDRADIEATGSRDFGRGYLHAAGVLSRLAPT